MNPAASQFTLSRFWEQGDAISHAVAFVLLAMSLVSWFFILAKAYASWRIRRSAPAVQAFWDAPSMQDGVNALALADSEKIFLPLAQQGAAQLSASARPSLGGEMDRSAQATRVLRAAIQASTNRLESGLTLLASIGATAPFVGLLGTVWGIYHALANVSSHGTVQIDKVAGPVGEALVMTAIGLTVAIPAVLAYNGFNRVNRLTLAELDAFAHDLHAYLTK
ncbi:outer membrane transport energization protein ExbB (TC 2.C.1.1.1) [Duganella sp. CF402]|uniref:MotA/TolQ/ExbB proton channel family protein n=1 Tax=unclassified Duganella TaxID=2636909 RepID=UPI0008CD8CAC|nr:MULTISPECIES: MotA/TolQ/ExbB proton channel family protein [unclassified Duganella]RZT08091.1 outer membrane transport energization protein ExbB [Duganella sp. BK701]SEM05968.1 outer membrane transport energization protein ExbB (TC 2.C.1.1.1) [Duganella sp. CF402]